ncbi:hypothetical protein [Streptomyces sp. NRRL B-24572]|uniref:hypothetical protein n=1 Tax=Streptomyces sp. NRRL B-24572 TaxID=1962156 RepID=UPI000A36183A|nr:hypothetical protein [Streptomyces sp. NRRL B-24572]
MPAITTDHVLMLLPFEEWISLRAAARATGLDESAANRIVRAGRRRGVLRTRGKGTAQQVRRIHTAPRRRAARQ